MLMRPYTPPKPFVHQVQNGRNGLNGLEGRLGGSDALSKKYLESTCGLAGCGENRVERDFRLRVRVRGLNGVYHGNENDNDTEGRESGAAGTGADEAAEEVCQVHQLAFVRGADTLRIARAWLDMGKRCFVVQRFPPAGGSDSVGATGGARIPEGNH